MHSDLVARSGYLRFGPMAAERRELHRYISARPAAVVMADHAVPCAAEWRIGEGDAMKADAPGSAHVACEFRRSPSQCDSSATQTAHQSDVASWIRGEAMGVK